MNRNTVRLAIDERRRPQLSDWYRGVIEAAFHRVIKQYKRQSRSQVSKRMLSNLIYDLLPDIEVRVADLLTEAFRSVDAWVGRIEDDEGADFHVTLTFPALKMVKVQVRCKGLRREMERARDEERERIRKQAKADAARAALQALDKGEGPD